MLAGVMGEGRSVAVAGGCAERVGRESGGEADGPMRPRCRAEQGDGLQ